MGKVKIFDFVLKAVTTIKLFVVRTNGLAFNNDKSLQISQRAHDVYTTSAQHGDVVLMSCACWVTSSV